MNLIRLNTIDQSTCVDFISLSLLRRRCTIGWAGGYRATYNTRRRDQLRILLAYGFCADVSFGTWANEVKFNDVMTIDQLNTIG